MMRRALVLLSLMGVVATGCGGGVTVTETLSKTPRPKETVRAYFLRDGKVAPVERSIYARQPLWSALTGGPTDEERKLRFTTAFPDTWYANKLSRQGLAQLVYTLTQFNPAKPVQVGTKTYARADFENETPAILVESPLPFQHVQSPLRATGTANTFEATFNYDLADPDGKIIATHFVTATSGSGTRGTFDFTVPFTVGRSGLGELIVYERSAANGQRIHISEIPVYFEK
jgi:hypothetical protein